MNNATRTLTNAGKISVDRVYLSDFQKEGTLTGQLRQVIVTKSFYPSKQAVNELTNSMFDNEDFGFSEQEFEAQENRVAFINVPVGVTAEQLQEMIDNIIPRNNAIKAAMAAEGVKSIHQLSEATKTELKAAFKLSDTKFAKLQLTPACIYKILSNHPITTSSQEYAIKEGLLTKRTLANRQVARYGEGAENAGQLVLDQNGKPQYRQTFFSEFHVENQDWRTADVDDFYSTPEISLELTGVIDDTIEVGSSPDSQGQAV